MLSKKMQEVLNSQMNFEIYSSYVYVPMASYLKAKNLNGFYNWMQIQIQEELAHAMKFHEFILDRGGEVVFEAIPKPEINYDSVLELFEVAYSHEQIVTGRINDLIETALTEKDHASNAHLQWFITEQVEEEANVLSVVEQIKLYKDSPNGLFLLDQELAKRVFVPPTK